MISRALAVLIFCVGLFCLSQQPRAFYQSRDSNYNINIASSGAAFTGMADIVASPIACWSLRACSAAKRGTKAVNVCNVADAACADFLTDATTGNLVIALVGGSDCTMVVCTIKTVYDQSGSTNCTAAACDVTMATIASRPVLTTSCIGSLPCATSTGARNGWTTAGNLTAGFAQPNTISAVAERTTNVTGKQNIITDRAFFDMGFVNVANSVYLYSAGAGTNVTANDNVIHAMQGLYNGGSASSIYVDGTLTSTGVLTSNSPFGGHAITVASGNNGALEGKWFECAMWNLGFSGANNSAMNGNQHTYWVF